MESKPILFHAAITNFLIGAINFERRFLSILGQKFGVRDKGVSETRKRHYFYLSFVARFRILEPHSPLELDSCAPLVKNKISL